MMGYLGDMDQAMVPRKAGKLHKQAKVFDGMDGTLVYAVKGGLVLVHIYSLRESRGGWSENKV